MTGEAPNSLHDAPHSDSHLEQWIAKAATNPLHIAAMWRAMKSAELHVIVPCDRETAGEFELGEGDALAVVTLEDADGSYAPVFTRLEQAEETAGNLGESFGVASAEGAALFVLLGEAGHHVVINPFSSPRLKIEPVIVHELATTGHVSRHALETAHDHTMLVPAPARDVPHDYLLSLRGRCAAHRRAIAALYLFHPLKGNALDPNLNEYRFMLRMHQRDEAFFKEFKEAATQGLPSSMTLNCSMVTDSQPETLAFLDTTRPIWPV